MKRKIVVYFICVLGLIACGQKERSNSGDEALKEFDTTKAQQVIDSIDEAKKSFPTPEVDTMGMQQFKEDMKKMNVTPVVYQNADKSYGYDITIDGHTYVHQPNIPAVPGNKGFETEAKAKAVGELVVKKIKNNIMPPTVDVRELDSLDAR